MKKIRIGTFNIENAFMRYKFIGPAVRYKKGEPAKDHQKRAAALRKKALAEFEQGGGPLAWVSRDFENFSTISHTQRKATAALITENDPDILALIEVESMEALKKFNSANYFGKKRYDHYMLIDGNDPRGIDVAILSKYPINHIRSYIDDAYKTESGRDSKTFSRDCLVVSVQIDGKSLTLFINHFKSQFQDNPARRLIQTTRVAEIVNQTFGDKIDTELFAVVGDFNQVPQDGSLKPLLEANWCMDVISKLPEEKRWTHVYEKNNKVQEVSQLDYILLSNQLKSQLVGDPLIERRGLARYSGLDKYYPD